MMTQRAPGIRETLGVCETLAAMTEQVLLATGITPDDPERAHWRSYVLSELRAAFDRGELAIGCHRPANAPTCLTIH